MARTAEITFKEFRRRYNSEDACRAELFRLRFPNGFVCPKCGCVEYYPIHGRNTFQCHSCRHQTSVTAGTVMHRTRLPLTLWFWAIYLCATDKRGISAVQLSHTLGICYDSAWHLLDRIRTAMGQRDEKYLLSGIVELDDGYVGGPSHNGKRGRGTDKAKIVVAVSKAENGVPLFARMKAVENVQGKTLQEIIDQYFAPNTKVECDGYRSYLNLEGVELSAKKYESDDLHWIHKAISNLEAFLLASSMEILKRSGLKIEMIAELINSVVRGWMNYFGRYNRSAMRKTLAVVQRRLIKWAMCKYKHFRGHRRRAECWLKAIQSREPNMFAHWALC